ncbi:hypothetical protein TNCV_1799751 [Trichonephila clavipes]|nr:hypothetical protein TNCV_1799751 [Trichonephila clavipes]
MMNFDRRDVLCFQKLYHGPNLAVDGRGTEREDIFGVLIASDKDVPNDVYNQYIRNLLFIFNRRLQCMASVEEHGTTPLRVKENIEDVSSEMVNGVKDCFSWMKRPELYCSRSASTAFMIRSLVGHFEELGSVADRPGRDAHQNIRTEDTVETVRQSFADGSSVSTRRFPELLTEQ